MGVAGGWVGVAGVAAVAAGVVACRSSMGKQVRNWRVASNMRLGSGGAACLPDCLAF